MKHTLALLAALVLLWSAPILTQGCKSTPQSVAYQTAATTRVSVDTAMHLWGKWVESGQSTVDQEVKVRDAFRKYQASMLVVCDAGAIYAASGTTNAYGATGTAAALQQAISNCDTTINDLLKLIASFGVKL